MAFWNDSSVEPKRAFRWLLYLPTNAFGSPAIETYAVTNVKKPSMAITETPVKYIAHTFKYPGRLTWNDVTCTLIDPISPDTSGILTKVLQSSGYKLPENDEAARFAFSKKNSVNALNNPRLVQLDGGDVEKNIAPREIEEWTLFNAWVKQVDYGSLDYTNENLVTISVTLAYDYPRYKGDFNAVDGTLKQIL